MCRWGPAQLAKACELQVRGPDAVIFHETCFGLGYALQPALAAGAGRAQFRPSRGGRALAFADPDAVWASPMLMNAMQFKPEGDPRSAGLVRAATTVSRGTPGKLYQSLVETQSAE